MMAIIGKLVYSAKLELVLDGMVLKAKYNGSALVSTTRLVGSADV
jgi:hypothetical protein